MSLQNPEWESRDIRDEKTREAYEQGHDADGVPEDVYSRDVEKGVNSNAQSTHTDERTLSGDTAEPEVEARDPNVVDWDGPDDPNNPQNWPAKKKWGIIAALGAITLITPLASSFFAPGVPQVLRTFNESSTLIAAFVVSVYILG
jgi:hypothetical protein